MKRFIFFLKNKLKLEELKDPDYIFELNEKNTSIHFWSVIVFNLVYLLWLVFDFILESKNFSYFFSIRIVFTFLNIINLILILLYVSKNENLKFIYIYLFNFFFAFFIAFSISLMFPRVENHFVPYMVGYTIPILGFGLIYFYPLRYYIIFVSISLLFHHIIFIYYDIFHKIPSFEIASGYFYLITMILVGCFVNYFRYNFFKSDFYLRKNLKEEEEKSEHLLKNIFPEEIIIELKNFNKVVPKNHNCATVLFIDFKNFTTSCEKMSPDQVIFYLNEYFSYFDEIIEFFHLEKIKTIGDGYLAVAGVPKKIEEHALIAVRAAMNIRSFVVDALENNKLPWSCRIGLHSGPVISGVIGKLKYTYDIFGDTVNIASRMESYGKPNSINISEATKQLVQDYYNCKHNATLKLKNGRLIRMYEILSEK